jgi:hypothetical protein
MIRNEREYIITLSRIDEFEGALAQIDSRTVDGKPMHPRQLISWKTGLQSQLDDLREEIAQYESQYPSMKVLRKEGEFVLLTKLLIRESVDFKLKRPAPVEDTRPSSQEPHSDYIVSTNIPVTISKQLSRSLSRAAFNTADNLRIRQVINEDIQNNVANLW